MLALIIVAFFGRAAKLILVIAILSWPQTARVVRASFLSLREAPFVDAARVGGMGTGAIILYEGPPNVLAPIVVTASLDVAAAILLEAGLGFFGWAIRTWSPGRDAEPGPAVLGRPGGCQLFPGWRSRWSCWRST